MNHAKYQKINVYTFKARAGEGEEEGGRVSMKKKKERRNRSSCDRNYETVQRGIDLHTSSKDERAA